MGNMLKSVVYSKCLRIGINIIDKIKAKAIITTAFGCNKTFKGEER